MEPLSPRDLYHPPTEHFSLKLPKSFSREDLMACLHEKFHLSLQDFEKILWHGGFYLDLKRLNLETLPKDFEAGHVVDVYRFLREPHPIPLTPRHILHEENDWLAALKPPWLPVQGTRVSLRFGLQEELRRLTGCRTLSAIHRLDRETSGVVLFAKNKQTEAALMKQFHDRKVEKRYLAVVAPPPSEKEWKVEGYLTRDFRRLPQNFYRLRNKPFLKSRWSETRFEQLKIEEGRALVEAFPKTGRTHQIRVHLAFKGSPVVGDTLYGKKEDEAERLQLHAYQIEFNGEERKQRRTFKITSPLPEDFLIRW